MTVRTYPFKFGADVIEIVMDLDMSIRNENIIEEYASKHHTPYEPEIANLMAKVLRPGDLVVDVGASVGFFSILAAKLVGETGTVLAFEPAGNVLLKLRNNLRLSGVNNVTIIDRPAWHKPDVMIDFYLDSDDGGGNAVWDPGLWPANVMSRARPRVEHLLTTTVDLHTRAQPRVLKIDAEGAELDVLSGAMAYPADFIVAEINPFGMKQMGYSTPGLREYMRTYGYEMFLLSHVGSLPALIPEDSVFEPLNSDLCMNVLFSTMAAVGEAWSKVP
jgi:FkbM family methyltransferase